MTLQTDRIAAEAGPPPLGPSPNTGSEHRGAPRARGINGSSRGERWTAVVVLGLLTGALALATMARFSPADVTSDTLYPLAISRDALQRDSAVHGWVLSPAPYLVPDVTGTSLLLALTGSAAPTYFGYQMAMFLALFAAVGAVTRRVGAGLGWSRSTSWLAAEVGFVGWLAASWLEVGWVTSTMIVTAGFHGGAIVSGLLLLRLVVDVDARPPGAGSWLARAGGPVAAAVTVAVVTFSDPILVPQFVLPVMAVVPMVRRAWSRWVSALGIGSVLGFIALINIERFGFSTGSGALPGDGESITRGVTKFVRDVPALTIAHPLQVLALAVVVATGWRPARDLLSVHVLRPTLRWCATRLRRPGSNDAAPGAWTNSSESDALAVALLTSIVVSLVATVAAKYDDTDHVRRFLPSLSLPLLFGLPLLAWSTQSRLNAAATRRGSKRRGSKRRDGAASVSSASTGRFRPDHVTWLGAVAALAAGALVLSGVRTTGLMARLPYQRHQACLDRLVASGDVDLGIADNWNARWFMELSRGEVVLVPVAVDLTFRPWIVNPDLVLHPDADAARFDYLLPARLDEGVIRGTVGEPDQVIDCSGLVVWRYEPGRLGRALRPYVEAASRQPGVRVLGPARPR